MTSAPSKSEMEVVFHQEAVHSFQPIPGLASRQSLEERLLEAETANRLKSDFLRI